MGARRKEDCHLPAQPTDFDWFSKGAALEEPIAQPRTDPGKRWLIMKSEVFSWVSLVQGNESPAWPKLRLAVGANEVLSKVVDRRVG
jgi:hypothetical protein